MEVIALRERIYSVVMVALLICVMAAGTANGQATISIYPLIQVKNIDFEYYCSVDVRVELGGHGLTGYDMEIQYDGAILDSTIVYEGDFPSSLGHQTFFFWTEEEGPLQTIIIHGAVLGGSVVGEGVLATIDFHLRTPGSTPVAFSFVELRDIENDPIPFVALDGAIEVVTPVESASWTAIKALYR